MPGYAYDHKVAADAGGKNPALAVERKLPAVGSRTVPVATPERLTGRILHNGLPVNAGHTPSIIM